VTGLIDGQTDSSTVGTELSGSEGGKDGRVDVDSDGSIEGEFEDCSGGGEDTIFGVGFEEGVEDANTDGFSEATIDGSSEEEGGIGDDEDCKEGLEDRASVGVIEIDTI